MNKTIISKRGALQGRDFSRGLIVGALSVAFYAVIEAVVAALGVGGIETLFERDTLLRIATVAISALLGYLLKNFAEPTKSVTIHGEENPPPMGDPTKPKKPKKS